MMSSTIIQDLQNQVVALQAALNGQTQQSEIAADINIQALYKMLSDLTKERKIDISIIQTQARIIRELRGKLKKEIIQRENAEARVTELSE